MDIDLLWQSFLCYENNPQFRISKNKKVAYPLSVMGWFKHMLICTCAENLKNFSYTKLNNFLAKNEDIELSDYVYDSIEHRIYEGVLLGDYNPQFGSMMLKAKYGIEEKKVAEVQLVLDTPILPEFNDG